MYGATFLINCVLIRAWTGEVKDIGKIAKKGLTSRNCFYTHQVTALLLKIVHNVMPQHFARLGIEIGRPGGRLTELQRF